MIDTLRFRVIGELVAGKSVLDVGCVDHQALRADRPEWLHVFVRERATRVVGLDVAREEAEVLMIRLTGPRSQIVYQPLPVDDPTQRCPDITKASSLLGWAPRVSPENGLRSTSAHLADM